jgi:hypothetical protein
MAPRHTGPVHYNTIYIGREYSNGGHPEKIYKKKIHNNGKKNKGTKQKLLTIDETRWDQLHLNHYTFTYY